MPPTKMTTFIYTNEPDAWDRFTIVQRWSDEIHPVYVDSRRADSIFPSLAGMLAPSHDNPSRFPREVYCSWFEGNMFDADYRRAHPEIDYSNAILVM